MKDLPTIVTNLSTKTMPVVNAVSTRHLEFLTSGPQHAVPRFLQTPPVRTVGRTNGSSQRT